MICWTLGITEHHNAVDNVLALINLSLLTGHVGRYGSGLNPLRGQNNVQGGGDMGALPDRLPGFQHVEHDAMRAKFDRAWGVPIPPKRGWHLSQMFEAMERGDLRALYVIGENPLQSEADQPSRPAPARGPGLPDRAGHVPDPDRRAGARRVAGQRGVVRVRGHGDEQRAPGAARAQGGRCRRRVPATTSPSCSISRGASGTTGASRTAETIWNELRGLVAHARGHELRAPGEAGGLQWPCYDEKHPGELFLHSRLWEWPLRGPRVAFVPVEHDPPVDKLDDEFPLRLTTGRRLDDYNTGVQTSAYASPLRCGETLDISPGGRRAATACARARSSAFAPGAASSRCRCARTMDSARA